MSVQNPFFERVVAEVGGLQLTEAGRALFWTGYFHAFERPKPGLFLTCEVQLEGACEYVVYGVLQLLRRGKDGYLELGVEQGRSRTIFFHELLALDGDPIRVAAAANQAMRNALRSRSRRRETILEL